MSSRLDLCLEYCLLIFVSGLLPPISYLDMEKIKRDNVIYGHSAPATSAFHMPAPSLISPSTIYSGPPPPYSYPPSSSSSVISGGGGGTAPVTGAYMSPPHTRRTSNDDKETLPSLRHSLPSIHEALSSNEQQPISISSLLSSAAPQQKNPLVSRSPTSPVSQSFQDAPKGPPESFPPQTSSNYRPYDLLERSNRLCCSPRGEGPFPAITLHDMHHSYQASKAVSSPTDYSRPALSSLQPVHSSSPIHDSSRSAANSNAPYSYNTYQSAYSFPPVTPTTSSYKPPTLQESAWRGMGPDLERVEEKKKVASKESPPPRPPYAESVKRHLDIFDLEASLNEVRFFHVARFGNQFRLTSRVDRRRQWPCPRILSSLRYSCSPNAKIWAHPWVTSDY